MKYRPDIDGLRAIAIVFVLTYHAGLRIFPSGFVGVDIFFVISGFLITSIINQAIFNNNFSFIQFYNRRLWRLQPVMISLIIFTLLLTILFYLPEDLISYIHSARKASLFFANKYFAKTTTGYFSPDINNLPLLHVWSLAIEWQFYILFPVLIYLLSRIIPPQYISKIFYLIIMLSFGSTLYFSWYYPEQTYYKLSSRFFEFLIGASIVLCNFRHFLLNKIFVSLLGIIAIFILFYIATRSDIKLGFPNGYALLLCFSTAILIAIGEHYTNLIPTQSLSVRPLVFIGLLSYSLYIWHWPILSILHYQNVNMTNVVLSITFTIIFILSYFSWVFIERPARHFNNTKFLSSIMILVVLPIILLQGIDLLFKRYAGFPQRFNDELVSVYKSLNQYSNQHRPLCMGQKIDSSFCMIGTKKSGSKKGLMFGDSFSNHYWNFMELIAKKSNVSIFMQGTSSCLALPNIYLYDWWHFKNTVYQECADQTERYFNMIKMGHYDYVVIGQHWVNYLGDKIINQLNDERSLQLSKKRISRALDEALNIIVNSGAKPVLIKASALIPNNFYDCFYSHIKLHTPYIPKSCDFILPVSKKDIWMNSLFARMQKKYPQLIVIDPIKVQCPAGKCKGDINGIPIYRDVGHLTDYASYQLGRLYLQQYPNPLSTDTKHTETDA